MGEIVGDLIRVGEAAEKVTTELRAEGYVG